MYDIPVRLVKLHKKQVDLQRELKNRGIKVYQSQLSQYVNGVQNPPKSDLVLSESDKIISEWEACQNDR